MRLNNHAQLAYCTNVHPGNDWQETFHSLQTDVLSVKESVSPNNRYAIGLRLSSAAASELADPKTLAAFRRWLDQNDCYVFTINGFPYGSFHGQRVKEQVYRPDWSSLDRLAYTNLLFDLLVQLLPQGMSGSVSTLPGSFKRFIVDPIQTDAIHENLYRCFQHIETLSERHDLDLHLGLEPEPLGLFETTPETVAFFDAFLDGRSDEQRVLERIGVNYDTCHLAVEFESAAEGLGQLKDNGIRVSKIHLSSALRVERPDADALSALHRFQDDVYLHQVISKNADGQLTRYEDLAPALAARETGEDRGEEWRIHYHIPLHASPQAPLRSTNDHLLETLDIVAADPSLCQHFEMETYTWAVLPEGLRIASVVEQIVREYGWLLPELDKRGLKA